MKSFRRELCNNEMPPLDLCRMCFEGLSKYPHVGDFLLRLFQESPLVEPRPIDSLSRAHSFRKRVDRNAGRVEVDAYFAISLSGQRRSQKATAHPNRDAFEAFSARAPFTQQLRAIHSPYGFPSQQKRAPPRCSSSTKKRNEKKKSAIRSIERR
ncbi:hypothetical protein NL676_017875 [Syzygium grande]|nr:hypothetical protein NL676_017875 [Syzygium grande]